MTDSAAIFDRDYRPYTGERSGLAGATRSLIVYSMQRVLGIHRPVRYKAMPSLFIIIAFVPALIYLGISALLPGEFSEAVVPGFGDYFALVTTALMLFCSFTAPQLLCADRRTAMLGVYLASPLTRDTYLVAKLGAIAILMTLIAGLPNLTFFTALVLQGNGPDSLFEGIWVVVRILFGAAIISTFYAAVSSLVCSFTDRVAVGTAATLATLVGSVIITNVLVLEADFTPHLRLLNLVELPRNGAAQLFESTDVWPSSENPTWTIYVAIVAIVLTALAVTRYRYQRLEVRR